MKFMIIIFWSLYGIGFLEANQNLDLGMEAQKVYYTKLMRASEYGEIQKIRAQYEKYEIYLASCQKQIEGREIPIYCFGWMAQVKRWKLVTKDRRNKIVAQLNQLCIDRVSQSRNLGKLKLLQEEPLLNNECGRLLERRISVLEYKRRKV